MSDHLSLGDHSATAAGSILYVVIPFDTLLVKTIVVRPCSHVDYQCPSLSVAVDKRVEVCCIKSDIDVDAGKDQLDCFGTLMSLLADFTVTIGFPV